MKTRFLLCTCMAVISLALVSAVSAADTKSDIEKALRDLDAEWSAAAGAKDVDKTVSYYAADAVVMPPNAPSISSREAIRSAWKEMLSAPGGSLRWNATKVEVAQSGDLACVSGTYEDSSTDAAGKPVKDQGKYIAIFKKQADGSWKAIVDIWNSDLPATPEEKK